MRKLLVILGVPVDDLTMDEALERLEVFIHQGRATGRTHQIATVNADFVVNSLHDPELRLILQEADMTTADGMPLVVGARLLGMPIAKRVTGADLVPALAERAAEKSFSLFLLGAREEVATRAAAILQQQHPALKIAGILSPPNVPIEEMDRSILDQICQAKPDILLVAFGNPKQEKWIRMYADTLQIPVCIGVGGTFDMIAGATRRAPRWVQQAGFEWLYRLTHEPKRLWRRYVRDFWYFSYFFLHQWWVLRGSKKAYQYLPQSEVTVANKITILHIEGRLDIYNYASFVEQAEEALSHSPFLIVSLERTRFLDSTAMGALVALTNRARAFGGALRLAAIPPDICRVLSLVRLDMFFDIYDSVDTAVGISAPAVIAPLQ